MGIRRRIQHNPAETQADFLEGDAFAYFVNGDIQRLLSREEMESGIHILCGRRGYEWHMTRKRFLVKTATGVLFKFEKVL